MLSVSRPTSSIVASGNSSRTQSSQYNPPGFPLRKVAIRACKSFIAAPLANFFLQRDNNAPGRLRNIQSSGQSWRPAGSFRRHDPTPAALAGTAPGLRSAQDGPCRREGNKFPQSMWPKLTIRNEIHSRRRLITRQLDDAKLSQPPNVIVGIAIAIHRAPGGNSPECLVVPGNRRGDPDAPNVRSAGRRAA